MQRLTEAGEKYVRGTKMKSYQKKKKSNLLKLGAKSVLFSEKIKSRSWREEICIKVLNN